MEVAHDPGTARFGNFINYYSFNPPNNRLELIGEDFLKFLEADYSELDCIHCLDIGCNSGDLTTALYEKLSSTVRVKFLGVELDTTLVERCHASNRYPGEISYQKADLTSAADRQDVISEYLRKHAIDRFHVVCCFSVTMWVHLNNGDAIFREFLSYVAKLSLNLLLEPQPWKCYRNAVRRMKRSQCEPFEHFEKLQWRTEVEKCIEGFLTENCAMDIKTSYGHTKWQRPVTWLCSK
ncbi:hypothetical protein CAPTEDRAFT_173134, partial [Capitella teleta]